MVGKRHLPVSSGRPTEVSVARQERGRLPLLFQETTPLCLDVAAVRSNLVVVTDKVKGYEDPITVLIDSGASYNFATEATVKKNQALYAKAVDDSNSNSEVSLRLARYPFA